ncbi:unnamed protein product [Periconia digitata]|uniref:Uncharacterized protein n=1 Tax=Periconia digitata TaxID=1303443 RepID=A0A9W4XXD9_9PLEO|nr:unnamed protein product [Periconia digitata]
MDKHQKIEKISTPPYLWNPVLLANPNKAPPYPTLLSTLLHSTAQALFPKPNHTSKKNGLHPLQKPQDHQDHHHHLPLQINHPSSPAPLPKTCNPSKHISKNRTTTTTETSSRSRKDM